MKSIRRHLLIRLFPGFLLLWIGAGAAIFFSAKQRYEAELNADLRDLLAAIPLGSDGLRTSLVTLQDFVRDDFGIYFQIWTNDGVRLLKSTNLGQFELIRLEVKKSNVSYADATLGSGDHVRLAGIRRDGGSLGMVDIIVGETREDADAALRKLLVAILGIGGSAALGFTLLLAISLRSGLRPLTALGEQATRIEADSLGARFPQDQMPGELSPIAEKLNDLMARLEESFTRERRFSSDLAHELRTPVAALKSTAEVALKWPDEVDSEEFEDVLKISVELQTTIENMLTLARLEKATNEVTSEAVSAREVVEDCWMLYSPGAAERELTFTNKVDPGMMIETDPKLFRVILSNLYSNAVTYAPRGSAVSVFEEDKGLVVCNPAPHLKESDLSKMFDRLWRHDKARTDSSHAGLGLSLAKTCAEVLGLDLSARLNRDLVEFTLRKSER